MKNFKFNLENHHQHHSITDPTRQPSIAGLASHGAVYKLMDPEYVRKRLAGLTLQEGLTAEDVVSAAQHLFFRLVNEKPYVIHAGLISYLTLPGKGKLTTKVDPQTGLDENKGNKEVPAFMTFVGQFVDHDLTQNLISLLDPQTGDVSDGASPLIDLDSVYTRSNALSNGEPDDIFDDNMKFTLVPLYDGDGKLLGYDHSRDTAAVAYIHDKRNDENQMISQVHILVEAVHNKLMDNEIADAVNAKGGASLFPSEIAQIFKKVQVEVVRNWQSFLWHQYLPTVVNEKSLNWVTTRLLDRRRHNELDQRAQGGALNMPHEFAISFRMGHTQLRDRYRVQKNAVEIPLFQPHDPTHLTDLTGGKHLSATHMIDWRYFADSGNMSFSNDIDTKVTNKVFDLPESAIPDNDKLVGNLPARNLIRSSQVELSNAEFIYDSLSGMPELGRLLKPSEIEPDSDAQRLFRVDNDGNYDPCNPFRTPLWYYILKEAELLENGTKLGPLGGRIVAGVIAAGIYFSDQSFIEAARGECAWKSKITGSEKVAFKDLVAFVWGS